MEENTLRIDARPESTPTAKEDHMTTDTISPAIRAKLANLPANNPAKRSRPSRSAELNARRDDHWTYRPHPIRGIITNAPHGTIIDSDEHGATISLKY